MEFSLNVEQDERGTIKKVLLKMLCFRYQSLRHYMEL